MKFRHLKKKDFIAYFGWFYCKKLCDSYWEVDIFKKGKSLYLQSYYEKDNGLYCIQLPFHQHVTWKDFKANLRAVKNNEYLNNNIFKITFSKGVKHETKKVHETTGMYGASRYDTLFRVSDRL